MAYFAKLDEANIVTEVHVVANQELDPENEEHSGLAFLTIWSNGHTNWKQTSYNGKIRKQFAGVGFRYDMDADVFIAPQPFPSRTLDSNFDWQPPKEKPDGFFYWDEAKGDWISVTQS